MDQVPLPSEQPLTPPNADVAEAYLGELDTVRHRREQRIDRRGMAFLRIADAVVAAAYVTLAMFGLTADGGGATFTSAIIVLLLWLQLSTERRESYGFLARPQGRERRLDIGLAAVLAVVVLGGFVLQVTGVSLPALVRFLPALFVLGVFGTLGLRALRRAGPAALRAGRGRLSRGARSATIGIGVLLALLVSSAGAPAALWYPLLVPMAGIIAVLGWWTAARISERLPALGIVWAWPQWTAFALGGAAVGGGVLLDALGFDAAPVLGIVTAAVVVLLFVVVSFLDGRDAG